MIRVVEGRGVGSGKSYYAAEKAFEHFLTGGVVCASASFELKWDVMEADARARGFVLDRDRQFIEIQKEDYVRMHEVTPAGEADGDVLIMLDEAQGAFNARDWGDKNVHKRAFFDWLCQSRHDFNDVVILTQHQDNIDKQIRRLLNDRIVSKNSDDVKLFGMTLTAFNRLWSFGSAGRCFIRTRFEGKREAERKWCFAKKEVYRRYNSWSMRLAHKRAGVRGRVKLGRVPVKRPRGRVLLVVAMVLCVFGYGVSTVVRGPLAKLFRRSSAPAEKIVEAPRVAVEREYLEGYAPGYAITSERIYLVGQENDLGLVRRVSHLGAEVVEDSGRVRKVVFSPAKRASSPVTLKGK